MKYTAEQFEEIVGFAPIDDDLERLNCHKAGYIFHMACGYCEKHNKPRFVCGCIQSNHRFYEEDKACKPSPEPNT